MKLVCFVIFFDKVLHDDTRLPEYEVSVVMVYDSRNFYISVRYIPKTIEPIKPAYFRLDYIL